MRLTLPTLRSAPPRPRQPPPPPEGEPDPLPSPVPVGRRRWVPSRSLIWLVAGAAVVLLCFGIGWGTDTDLLTMGSGRTEAGPPKQAERDRAVKQREAADQATARKVAAANAADAQAAARRAAEAKAAQAEATRRQVVAMPHLVGRKLDVAMKLAADAGLTAVTVCRTPGDDTPLWWPNWRVTEQDVPAGMRVRADRQICLAATK